MAKKDGQKIIAGLAGGLGNQMFQYAAARSLALRLKLPLALDLTWFAGWPGRAYALDGFQIDATAEKGCALLPAAIHRLQYRLSSQYATRRKRVPVFRERNYYFDEAFNSLCGPVYLKGYWQTERYFSGCRDRIRSDFRLAGDLDAERVSLLNRIQDGNSVSVHVRRGDYVSNQAAAAHHGVCPPDWYSEVVKRINQLVERPKLFVFSDDINWSRANLRDLKDAEFIYPSASLNGDHQDIYLMSLCKHHIVANSSFSWWGAWLNPYPEKIVLAPKKWFASGRNDTRDLLPKRWIQV